MASERAPPTRAHRSNEERHGADNDEIDRAKGVRARTEQGAKEAEQPHKAGRVGIEYVAIMRSSREHRAGRQIVKRHIDPERHPQKQRQPGNEKTGEHRPAER